MLIDNTQQWTTAYAISSPGAFGAGELKSIKSVQAYMMNISMQSVEKGLIRTLNSSVNARTIG